MMHFASWGLFIHDSCAIPHVLSLRIYCNLFVYFMVERKLSCSWNICYHLILQLHQSFELRVLIFNSIENWRLLKTVMIMILIRPNSSNETLYPRETQLAIKQILSKWIVNWIKWSNMTYLFFRSMVFQNYSLNVFAHFFAMIDYKYKCTLTRKFCENKTV